MQYSNSVDFSHKVCIALLVVAVPRVLSVEISARQACIDDFSPCICSEQNGAINVKCNGVYGGDIREAFARATSTNHVDVLNIRVPDDCGIFPADMFSGKSVTEIYIEGNSCSLYIDPNAFTSSSNRTKVFNASYFSLRLLDFAFLKGFSALSAIMFFSCSDMSALQHLPSLPTVAYFYSLGSVGSANMTDFPAGRSFSGLIQFMWARGDLNDELAETICENIAQTTSVYTLNYFDLNSNRLTHIPTGLSHLQNNPGVYLHNNSITSLKTGSVLFHVGSPYQLLFRDNPITSIEPAAFVGKPKRNHSPITIK